MPSARIRQALMLGLTLVLASVSITFLIGLNFYPPVAAFGLLLMGRGPERSMEAVRAFHRRYRHPEFEQRILKASRVVQTEGGYQLMETPKGRFWEPAIQGTAVVAQLAELEAKYSGFKGQPVFPGDVVLDCGANVGTFTRAALDWGAKTVVAIEPAPDNIECLRRNFAREISEGRVIVYPKGVWDKDDWLILSIDPTTSAMDTFVRREGRREGPKLPLTTIDKLVVELRLQCVDFIKMDIEGAEQKALAGARTTLGDFHPRLEISVNHLPEDPEKVPQIVRQAWPGYRSQLLECEAHRRSWRIDPEIIFFR